MLKTKNQQKFVVASSFIAFIFYGWYLYCFFQTTFKASSSSAEFWNEIVSLFITLPIIFPAMLGLLFFRKVNEDGSRFIVSIYIIYFLTIILCLAIFVVPFKDASQAELPMVVLVIPIMIVLTILLCTQLSKIKPLE